MKRAKRVFFVIFMIVVVSASFCFANDRIIDKETKLASELKTLNLFKGVSDTDYDLNRAPSRIEALVMLIRAMGKESEALECDYSHPFTDVESWADRYVAYAYKTGLTKGSSATLFGTGNANSAMYLTFMLRALGYSDSAGDFSWDNPYDLADNVGMLPDLVNRENFLRADCVSVTYDSLDSYIKNTTKTLAEKLIDSNVFTYEDFTKTYNAGTFISGVGLTVTPIDNKHLSISFVGDVKDSCKYFIMYGVQNDHYGITIDGTDILTNGGSWVEIVGGQFHSDNPKVMAVEFPAETSSFSLSPFFKTAKVDPGFPAPVLTLNLEGKIASLPIKVTETKVKNFSESEYFIKCDDSFDGEDIDYTVSFGHDGSSSDYSGFTLSELKEGIEITSARSDSMEKYERFGAWPSQYSNARNWKVYGDDWSSGVIAEKSDDVASLLDNRTLNISNMGNYTLELSSDEDIVLLPGYKIEIDISSYQNFGFGTGMQDSIAKLMSAATIRNGKVYFDMKEFGGGISDTKKLEQMLQGIKMDATFSIMIRNTQAPYNQIQYKAYGTFPQL